MQENLIMVAGMQRMFRLSVSDRHVVLMYGANIPVAVFAGVLGGIIGGPIAQFFSEKLPEGVHGTVANVIFMADFNNYGICCNQCSSMVLINGYYY